MTSSHGSNADVMGNGYVLSEFLNSAQFSGSVDAGETTTFKKKSKTYIPGLKDTIMNAEGVFDGDPDAADDILWAAIGSDADGLFSYIPKGHEVVGHQAFSMDAIEGSYEINTEVGDIAQISAELSAGTKGQFRRGLVARPMDVAVGPGTGPEVDNGAPTADRVTSLVVHCVTAVSLDVKLQHATTLGGTYVDLPGTIEVSSGRASLRLLIPPQSVDRYTRVSWTGSGTFMAIVER